MPVSTERLTAEADESHAGLRLDRFLSGRFPELSRTRLQALIRQGHVALGRATIEDVKYPVKPGDRFKISVPRPVSAHPQAQEIPLNVLYEDDSIIVIDKPAGLVVHPGAGNIDRTLVNALIAHCGASLSGIGGVARPGIVHRLDKDTSGLLVVAKTDRAHRALSEQFADHGREGSLERGYLALVWGTPPRPHAKEAAKRCGDGGGSEKHRHLDQLCRNHRASLCPGPFRLPYHALWARPRFERKPTLLSFRHGTESGTKAA